MLVDCDVHVSYASVKDLRPYVDGVTRELIDRSGTRGLELPGYPWMHPSGWIRRDTYDPAKVEQGGLTPAFPLSQLREDLLDRFDVRHAIAIPDEPAGFSVLPNGQLAAALCRGYNDWLLEHWLQAEPRLKGTIVVPAQWPEAAAEEIRRVGARDEFVGVFLPGGARIPYGNPVYEPIWRAANDLGLPVVCHVHYEGVGIAGPLTAAGMPDFYAEFHALTGSSLYGHFVSVLCHGIFERFPNTRMMLMEGGLVPYVGYLWRLDQNWRSCRIEIPHCRRRPSEYVWDHVRFSTQPLESPDDEQQLHAVLAALNADRTLCFSSDYPHWDFDTPGQTLRTLPEAWRESIAWKNAADFYGLSMPATVTA